MSSTRRFVAYFRVSTVKQGRSGLGLDVQRSTVNAYISGQDAEIIAEYIEVESGRRKDRRQLTEAIRHARAARASLIIAKLDRLARSVSFTSALMESGIEFVCCDLPSANKFTIHIMSALAEMEAEMISTRTKAALAEAKRRGVRLGNPMLHHYRPDPALGADARRKLADDQACSYIGLILAARQQGATTLQATADYLNQQCVLTPAGNQWHASTVRRLIKRAGL